MRENDRSASEAPANEEGKVGGNFETNQNKVAGAHQNVYIYANEISINFDKSGASLN